MRIVDDLKECDIQHLHRALSIKEFFSAVEKISKRYIPCHSVSVYFNYLDPGDEFHVIHQQSFPGPLRSWKERRKFSPAAGFLRENPGVKMYRLSQLIQDSEELYQSPYFTEVMKKEGWRYLLVRIFWRQNKPETLIAFRRSREQGEFEPEEVELLNQLHPHLQTALDRIRRVQELEVKHLCLSQALVHLRQGIILYDISLKHIFRNKEALHSCEAWNQYGRKLPEVIASQIRRLADEWKRTFNDAAKNKLMMPQLVCCPGKESLAAMVQIVRSNNYPLANPFFLIQFIDSSQHSRWNGQCPLQRNLHLEKLSDQEREVACLAANGFSNQMIAHELGKCMATVKCQLTSVYRKFGITSRMQLIVMLK